MPASPALLLPVLALPLACLGAAVGSFLQLVAWRLPRRESIVRPASHCPRCGTPLAWHDNLPLLGWLLLAGRCRHCRTPISARYPLVELLLAGLWVAMPLARPAGFGPAPPAWLLLGAGLLLAGWLVPLALIDGDSLWLPEPLCRWGLLSGLGVTALIGFSQGAALGRTLLLAHLLAAAAGLLGLEALSALAGRVFGRPALGLGDAKLAALMGAWLGPAGLAAALVLAVFGGAVLGGLARLSGRLGPQQPFPFGPFLAAATLVVWFTGHAPWLELLGLPA
jgi:leader peptidase (prepilin peptidase)/N-methyltransferase